MRAIDIHAHLTPQCFWRATDNGGDSHTPRRARDVQGTEFAVVGSPRQPLPPRARWTPEEPLADMDSLGVDVHAVSPYVGFYDYHLDTPLALATAPARGATASAGRTMRGRCGRRRGCTCVSRRARISGGSTTTASFTPRRRCATSSTPWASTAWCSGRTGRTTWRSTGRSRGSSA